MKRDTREALSMLVNRETNKIFQDLRKARDDWQRESADAVAEKADTKNLRAKADHMRHELAIMEDVIKAREKGYWDEREKSAERFRAAERVAQIASQDLREDIIIRATLESGDVYKSVLASIQSAVAEIMVKVSGILAGTVGYDEEMGRKRGW